MSDETEVKTNFSIKVRSHRGEEVHFKVKPHTQMEKIMKAFCEKVGTDMSTVRLTFDGQRVSANQLVSDVGLEDGDVLDAMEFQVGGAAL